MSTSTINNRNCTNNNFICNNKEKDYFENTIKHSNKYVKNKNKNGNKVNSNLNLSNYCNPYLRRILTNNNINKLNINSQNNEVSITSFNLLAKALLEESLHINISELKQQLNKNKLLLDNINQETRDNKVINELKFLNSSIVCFQEMENNDNLIKRLREELNYDLFLRLRPTKEEGCGICFKRDQFEKINDYFLELRLKDNNNTNCKSNSKLNYETMFNKENIAVFSLLKKQNNSDIIEKENDSHNFGETSRDEYFLIVNTHLLFNSRRGDIKVSQITMILKAINKIIFNFKESKSCVNPKDKYITTLFCGDFNSTYNSAIYRLITKGEINCSYLNRYNVSCLILLNNRIIFSYNLL